MEKLIEKYVAGTATEEERAKVLKWSAESPENRALIARIKSDYVFSHMPGTAPSESSMNAIVNSLEKPRHLILKIASGIAAAAAAVVIVFSIHRNGDLQNQVKELQAINARLSIVPELPQDESVISYIVNPGVKGHVILPDSSEVWLNSATELRCPSTFEDGKRVVELNGEGYFKVRHNADWPMYVRTCKGVTVKVTGTEFDLSSYSDDAQLKITLVNGSVQLMDEERGSSIPVKVNEEVSVRGREGLSASERKAANMKVNTSWKDGFLVFDNTPVEEVVKKLNRWYGINIAVTNPALMDHKVTAAFYSESISQVLDLMRITCGINSTIRGDTEVLLH